jgi:hypothetical protein
LPTTIKEPHHTINKIESENENESENGSEMEIEYHDYLSDSISAPIDP